MLDSEKKITGLESDMGPVGRDACMLKIRNSSRETAFSDLIGIIWQRKRVFFQQRRLKFRMKEKDSALINTEIWNMVNRKPAAFAYRPELWVVSSGFMVVKRRIVGGILSNYTLFRKFGKYLNT